MESLTQDFRCHLFWIGVILSLKKQVHCLEEFLDRGLLLDKQVVAVVSAFYQLQLVSQVWNSLGRKVLAAVVRALVTFRLDYCNSLFLGLPLKRVWKL